MHKNTWYVYICDKQGQLYTGITTNLEHRMRQHKGMLLYSESFENKNFAASREKEIKSWGRKKKLELIKSSR
jgi:putative endonuclease